MTPAIALVPTECCQDYIVILGSSLSLSYEMWQQVLLVVTLQTTIFRIQPLLQFSSSTTWDGPSQDVNLCNSLLIPPCFSPDFWQSLLHTAVRVIPFKCKPERWTCPSGISSRAGSTSELLLTCAPPLHPRPLLLLPPALLPTSLLPCPQSVTRFPSQGFHTCFFYSRHSFPKYLQASIPSFPLVSAQRPLTLWGSCLMPCLKL